MEILKEEIKDVIDKFFDQIDEKIVSLSNLLTNETAEEQSDLIKNKINQLTSLKYDLNYEIKEMLKEKQEKIDSI